SVTHAAQREALRGQGPQIRGARDARGRHRSGRDGRVGILDRAVAQANQRGADGGGAIPDRASETSGRADGGASGLLSRPVQPQRVRVRGLTAMKLSNTTDALRTRRQFLRRAAHGFGGLALATMFAEEAAAAPSNAVFDPFLPKKPHFEAKAKS